MTLDEAIDHHTWAAQNSEGEVAEEHEQYAAWLWELRKHRHIADTLCANTRAAILERDTYKSENARYCELVEILRRDWHIEASWDGLRKFWYVGLTEDGVRERDERDAKVMEAANIEIGELRELVRNLWDAALHPQTFGDGSYLRGELEKLGIEV